MIAVIRIKGMIDVNRDIEEALYRMRLRRKYACVLLEENPENRKLLKKVRDFVSYGEVSPEIMQKLITERGKAIDGKKIDAKKIVESLGKKNMKELGLKPFFRLHPPRGGIETKKHAGVGKGVLGENKKINELLEKML